MCDANEHLRWIRDEPDFVKVLGGLARDGERARRASLAWREYGVIRVDDHAAARARRYRTRLEALAKVLPPSLRPAVQLLALDDQAPLDVGPSYRLIDDARVSRLQELCRMKLAHLAGVGQALNRGRRDSLERTLTLINPSWVRLPALFDCGLADGSPAAVNATAAASRLWLAGASTAGYPVVGIRSGDHLVFDL
jgi:hypothetical protein